MKIRALCLALALTACGGDDPPVDPVTVGAGLIVTFDDGRVDSLSWSNAQWYRSEPSGSGRLVVRADALDNEPSSPDAHKVWQLMVTMLGPRFAGAPSNRTFPIGITGSDTVWVQALVGSGGNALTPGTVRIEFLPGDLISVHVDADAEGSGIPFHLTGTIVSSPALQ
jgi:hypothetical protein